MNRPSLGNSNSIVFVFILIMVLVAMIGSFLAFIVDLYFSLPSDKGFRFILFSVLIGSSIFFHCWILEFFWKQRTERYTENSLQRIGHDIQNIQKLLGDTLIPVESRKLLEKQLNALLDEKWQYQGHSQILPTQQKFIIFGDYYKNMTDNKQQVTARDINIQDSPGTNFGIENVSADVANRIQQLPDSNNKSVLQQLQKELEQNDKLSAQDKEDALSQIQVLANMPTTQLTPTQRSTLRVARDFLIGFGAGMFANLVSKFVIS